MRRSGASAERIAKAARPVISSPSSPTTRSALRVISRASASRARVVWPTTTSTAPVKPRSENRRLTDASRTGSPAKRAVPKPGLGAGRATVS